jgi:hypothetical protein
MREGAESVPVDGEEHSPHGPRALFNTCAGFSSGMLGVSRLLRRVLPWQSAAAIRGMLAGTIF